MDWTRTGIILVGAGMVVTLVNLFGSVAGLPWLGIGLFLLGLGGVLVILASLAAISREDRSGHRPP